MPTPATHALRTPRIETTRWRIDPTRSSVEFHVKGFWGLTTVRGRFGRYQGTLDLAAGPAVELVVESGSLDTKNQRRDKHLRSSDFFDADRHPYVRFVSDAATLAGQRLSVRGRLHVRGQSMPLELQATVRPVGGELALEALTEIDHRRLGMTWNAMGMIRTPTRVVVTGRLVRDAGAAGGSAQDGGDR
jgi:polyisoprenoid-binding protein YceI